MEHTHYFQHQSDPVNFCEEYPNARIAYPDHLLVVIYCESEEELRYWQDCEELGPFPHDGADLR